MLVLLFHAGVPGMRGGYVGVDVFFVLSGYLITGLLLQERTGMGTIRLGAFYARRLRRLLPAATVVIVTTLVVARVVLPPLLVAPTATDGLWAAGWLANLRFIVTGLDYLGADGPESPLLHFWSLAVEEQFYLLWPALLLLVTRGRVVSVSRRVGVAVIGIGAASLAASIWLTPLQPVASYYGLHTRTWELAVGAGLAVLSLVGWRAPARLAPVLSWGGLAAVVATALLYTDATRFPGAAALVPVVGTAALLLAGERDPAAGAGRLLGLRAAQVVGRMSYSLYLWHWPVLVLGEHAAGRPLAATERAALLGLSALLAWVTLRVVEDPIRRRAALAIPRRSFALGGALVTASVAAALLVVGSVPALTGSGERTAPVEVATTAALGDLLADAATADLLPASLEPPLASAATTLPRIYDDGCFVGWDDTRSPDCVYGDPAGTRTTVLFGDSHAAQWFPTLERIATEQAARLIVLTKPSCPSADVVAVRRLEQPYPACTAWREASIERIQHERPDAVVISNARTYAVRDETGRPTGGDHVAELAAGLERTIRRIREVSPGTDVVVLGDTPRPGFDVPTCLSEHLEDVSSCAAEVGVAVAPRVLATQRAVAERAGARFVDPTPWLCTDVACPAVVGDLLVYFDEDHLTPAYARSLAPVLEAGLAPRPSPATPGGDG